MTETLNIVIADDHPLVRTGLRQVIEREAGYTVVGEAGDGESALASIRDLHPDIAVIDLEMPRMNGLDLTRRISSERLPTAVIILTMYDDEAMFNEAMDYGVLGYVLKDSASMDIIKAIRAVARGEYFVSSDLSNLALKPQPPRSTSTEMRLGLLTLSPSERRVLKLVSDEKSSSEIAEILGISQRTVDNHRSHICHKLGLNGSNALLRFALTHRTHI